MLRAATGRAHAYVARRHRRDSCTPVDGPCAVVPAQAHFNGQFRVVDGQQMNYISIGAGAKDANMLTDQIVLHLTESLHGEIVLMILSDCGPLIRNAQVAQQLQQKVLDAGMVKVFDHSFLGVHDSKHWCDSIFSGCAQFLAAQLA